MVDKIRSWLWDYQLQLFNFILLSIILYTIWFFTNWSASSLANRGGKKSDTRIVKENKAILKLFTFRFKKKKCFVTTKSKEEERTRIEVEATLGTRGNSLAKSGRPKAGETSVYSHSALRSLRTSHSFCRPMASRI